MGIKNLIRLKIVDENDAKFLYDLLKERDSTVNVDHKDLPTFEKHVDFIKSNPYDGWYIILADSTMIGHIFIDSENRIGWFVKKEYKGFGFVVPAFEQLKQLHKREKYIGKINPKNLDAQNLIVKLNFILKETHNDYLLYEYNISRTK